MALGRLRLEVQAIRGESNTIEYLSGSDSLQTLFEQVSREVAIPIDQLILCHGEQELPPDCSHALEDCGIADGTVLNALRVPKPHNGQIYACTSNYDGFATHTWELPNESEARLLLFRGTCVLVSKQFHDSDNTFWTIRTLQWDILHGTYWLNEDVAECVWEAHVQRTMRFELDRERRHVEETDSGWQQMDERSSLKWKRIPLHANGLPDFSGMSDEEAKQFMISCLKSRGFDTEADEEVQEWLLPFSNMDEYNETWDPEEGAFKSQVLQACQGQGLNFDTWKAREGGTGFRFAAALANRWCRLELDRETAGHAKRVYPPCLDFASSRLLGFDVCDLSAYVPEDPIAVGPPTDLGSSKPLDLVSLPQLLGFCAGEVAEAVGHASSDYVSARNSKKF